VKRGLTLFEAERAACTTCHAGEAMTNNQTRDIGTGGAFQVPSLRGLAHRAPFMHAGCAATLRELFSASCGGEPHALVAAWDATDLDDLLAYLESL
jgi:cytochrome c peroxidase